MQWHTDSTLQRRMVAALALSVLGYGALIGGLAFLLPSQVAAAVIVTLVALVAVVVREADRLTYVLTDAYALERGRFADPNPHDVLGRLAQQADVARPALAVIPSDEPNAITAGTGERSVVCVTTGLLGRLDDDQLEAVLAHEVAHLKNGDTAVMTVAGFPATLSVLLLSLSARAVNWKTFVLGYLFVPVYLAMAGVPLLLVSAPGTVLLARYREYAADRGAVALTGDPVALATALGDLYEHAGTPEEDLRGVAGLAAFAIVPTASWPDYLPALHPSTAERIRRLKDLSDETPAGRRSE